MVRQVIKGFMAFAVIAAAIIWAAWILAAIWRGYGILTVYNSVITVTLCLLCWLMVERIEALVGQRRDMTELAGMERRRYLRLRKAVRDLRKIIDDGEWQDTAPGETIARLKKRLNELDEDRGELI